MRLSRAACHRVESLNLLTQPQIFPTQSRNRHIAVFPQIVVEGSQAEFLLLINSRVRQKLHNLQFADLISDCLAENRRSDPVHLTWFSFQLPNPLLQELPLRFLLGQGQSFLIRGPSLSCPAEPAVHISTG
jgi:hypothetical protein